MDGEKKELGPRPPDAGEVSGVDPLPRKRNYRGFYWFCFLALLMAIVAILLIALPPHRNKRVEQVQAQPEVQASAPSTEIESLRNQVADLQDRLKQVTETRERAEHNKQITDLQQQVTDLNKELDNVNKANEEADKNQQVASLQQQVSVLREQLSNTREAAVQIVEVSTPTQVCEPTPVIVYEPAPVYVQTPSPVIRVRVYSTPRRVVCSPPPLVHRPMGMRR